MVKTTTKSTCNRWINFRCNFCEGARKTYISAQLGRGRVNIVIRLLQKSHGKIWDIREQERPEREDSGPHSRMKLTKE
jgi:hypothetical protein